jgi:hypothetical protein
MEVFIMSRIVAGHFQLQNDVEQARQALLDAGFSEDGICGFFLNQPGQHDMTPIGGDRAESPGAQETPIGVVEGAATGGAVGAAIGAATSPVTGPVGPVVGGLVGAHVGSLFSFSKMKERGEGEDGGNNQNQHATRRPGMVLAVALDDPADEPRALDVLRQQGASDIELAEGHVENGDWVDFDPLSTPHLIH